MFVGIGERSCANQPWAKHTNTHTHMQVNLICENLNTQKFSGKNGGSSSCSPSSAIFSCSPHDNERPPCCRAQCQRANTHTQKTACMLTRDVTLWQQERRSNGMCKTACCPSCQYLGSSICTAFEEEWAEHSTGCGRQSTRCNLAAPPCMRQGWHQACQGRRI